MAHGDPDEAFGTLQDLTCTHPLRSGAHLWEMQEAYSVLDKAPEELGLATHLSVERPPALDVPPTQLVPLSLHLTIGGNARLLQLEIEAVIVGSGPVVGRKSAHWLEASLSVNIGAEPVPFHGRNFNGPHGHVIAARSAAVVAALRVLVRDSLLAAYERARELWRRVLPTLSRAATILIVEKTQFQADARALVRLIQGSFPWVSIFPKLHMQSAHSWQLTGT